MPIKNVHGRRLAGSCVLLIFISLIPTHSTWSQTGESSTKAKAVRTPVFEVVSIRENTSHDESMSWGSTANGITMKNLNLDLMIRTAYGLLYSNEDQIAGLPPWAKSEHFDLEARVSEEDAALLKDLTEDQRREMLMAVLVDRFKMKAHIETKERPVYALVLARSGTKLTEVKAHARESNAIDPAGKDAPPAGGYMASDREVDANGIPIESIVSILTSLAQREVIDKTGLKGKYSFNLKFTPDREADSASATSQDSPEPPLFTAIQEQLGLRLDATKGPVRGVVVDQIEKPSAN